MCSKLFKYPSRPYEVLCAQRDRQLAARCDRSHARSRIMRSKSMSTAGLIGCISNPNPCYYAVRNLITDTPNQPPVPSAFTTPNYQTSSFSKAQCPKRPTLPLKELEVQLQVQPRSLRRRRRRHSYRLGYRRFAPFASPTPSFASRIFTPSHRTAPPSRRGDRSILSQNCIQHLAPAVGYRGQRAWRCCTCVTTLSCRRFRPAWLITVQDMTHS